MKARIVVGATLAVTLLAASGCGSKEAPDAGGAETGILALGASLSLTGATAKEGGLTKEGYEVCKKVVNDKGGVSAGGKTYTLNIEYQDDTSKGDVSAQLADQYNDRGIK